VYYYAGFRLILMFVAVVELWLQKRCGDG